MPILTLLNRVKETLAHAPHPVAVKTASVAHQYLIGLAMLAHADGTLTETERNHFLEMAEIFDVNQADALGLLNEAAAPTEQTVAQIRTALMDSKYKYYFILDLQIMAHQDLIVKPVEHDVVRRFGEILEVEPEDRAFLVSLADAVAHQDQQAKEAWCRNFFSLKSTPKASPDDFRHYTG